jgi:hypothetical protein
MTCCFFSRPESSTVTAAGRSAEDACPVIPQTCFSVDVACTGRNDTAAHIKLGPASPASRSRKPSSFSIALRAGPLKCSPSFAFVDTAIWVSLEHGSQRRQPAGLAFVPAGWHARRTLHWRHPLHLVPSPYLLAQRLLNRAQYIGDDVRPGRRVLPVRRAGPALGEAERAPLPCAVLVTSGSADALMCRHRLQCYCC